MLEWVTKHRNELSLKYVNALLKVSPVATEMKSSDKKQLVAQIEQLYVDWFSAERENQ